MVSRKEEEDAKLPTKGKPSSFFLLEDDTPNKDQKLFVFEHYPTHGAHEDMVAILSWLYNTAAENEAYEEQLRTNNEAYASGP